MSKHTARNAATKRLGLTATPAIAKPATPRSDKMLRSHVPPWLKKASPRSHLGKAAETQARKNFLGVYSSGMIPPACNCSDARANSIIACSPVLHAAMTREDRFSRHSVTLHRAHLRGSAEADREPEGCALGSPLQYLGGAESFLRRTEQTWLTRQEHC